MKATLVKVSSLASVVIHEWTVYDFTVSSPLRPRAEEDHATMCPSMGPQLTSMDFARSSVSVKAKNWTQVSSPIISSVALKDPPTESCS